MRTILLPSGPLLVPVEPDDPADGFGLREIGPENPEYGRYLAFAEPGGDLRPREEVARRIELILGRKPQRA
jgi:hypothetical protein